MNILYNVIIPLASALVGGFISLWIYKEGEKKKIQDERRKKIESNFQTEKYFFHNIDSILFFIDRQIEEISKTSKNTKNWNINKLNLSTMSELKLTELRELNFESLYQNFVIDREGDLTEKALAFINIKNCLHNIEDFSENQKIENLRPLKEIQKYIDLWNESLQRLMGLYNSYVVDKPGKEDKLIPILNNYLVKKQRVLIQDKKDQNISNFYENLILPMQNDIISLKSDIDYRAEPIIKEVLNCKKAYIQIKAVRYHRRKDVLFAGRRLLKIKELLKESCKEIKNSKPRSVNGLRTTSVTSK